MKKRIFWIALTLLGLFFSMVSPVLADGIIIPEPPPDVPFTEVPNLAIKYHKVKVTIDDQVATTYVDQVFVNESRYELEGLYIFPLPEGAAVSEFAMWVDGERLEARVLDKDEARRIYEDIVRKRRDPALLEYLGRGAFQVRIFPIPPHSEKRVELEYSEVLNMDQGLVRYVYPLNTEKFSSRPIEEVVVSIDVHSSQAIKAIYSPSHAVAIDRESDYRFKVGFEEYEVKPDRDFELYYSVSAGDFGLNLLSYKPRGEDGFFLLLAAPQVEVKQREVVAKDVIFVLDVSGSMKGEKLAQAQEAVEFVLDNLHEEDRFNIIAFSTGLSQYASRLVPAEERNEARRFVRNLEAVGGTDINRALLEALSQAQGERPQIIIFLTDGLATEGEVDTQDIIDNVDDAAGPEARIFTFGVGDEVNTILLDTIAQQHRGASAYVRPGQNIDEEVSAFYAKVSVPLLTNIDLDFGDIHIEDTYPYPLPDLFAGSQLVLVGRYREGGNTTITLSGEVNDQPKEFVYDDISFRERGGQDFIPRLWATRKIGYLLNQIRLHGESQELVEEIVDLSVRYGIITPYTSFLIEEDADILTSRGREARARKEYEAIATAPAPDRGGGPAAVDAAEGEAELRTAETPAEPAVEEVHHLGDKAFVLKDGIWMDTTYDPDGMETIKIGLLSDTYFAFLAAHPEWGPYFALGDHVIVVLEGQAYEIVEGDYPPVDVP